jgi:hypothetical protein
MEDRQDTIKCKKNLILKYRDKHGNTKRDKVNLNSTWTGVLGVYLLIYASWCFSPGYPTPVSKININ